MNEIIYPIILTYEQKRASIQNLSFEYAELLLKKLRIDFGDVQKRALNL